MKLKLPPALVKLAYKVFDVEASAETASAGGRMIEYAFVIEKLARHTPGKLLDVGCTARMNPIPATLAGLGWEVWGLDLREFKFRHPNFHFVSDDISSTSFEDGFFDAVSTLEHLGLSGRYGVTEENLDKDAMAVREIQLITKQGGTFLATVPFASNARIIKPFQRVYDRPDLESLFSDWVVRDKVCYELANNGYWAKLDGENEGKVENRDGDSAVALLELANREK